MIVSRDEARYSDARERGGRGDAGEPEFEQDNVEATGPGVLRGEGGGG